MAGSILVAKTDLGGSVTKYSVAWTSDGSGAVNGNAFDIKRGHIVGLKFVAGSPTPTTGYAITLLDPDGADLLVGAGATVATPGAAYAEAQKNNLPIFCEGFSAVTPTVSAAGATTQGTLVVIVEP